MISEKDILARLQAGESADSIANNLIDTLNKANATYEAEKERTERFQKKKEQALINIIQDLFGFIAVYHPELNKTLQESMNKVSMKELAADLDKSLASMEDLSKGLNKLLDDSSKDAVKASTRDSDAVLDAFLKRNHW